MAIMLEDLGGVRLGKAEQRARSARTRNRSGEVDGHAADLDEKTKTWEAGLAPPTATYLLHGLLPLSPANGSRLNGDASERDEVRRKMGWIKLQLIALVDELFPIAENVAWREVFALGEDWSERVRKTMDEGSWAGIEAAVNAVRDELGRDT
jgi:hypothetical protein